MTDSTTKRIISLDLLRGYLLFFIIVDHLGRFPGLFDLLTGRGWLWVSASEGFFFISGLMVGYVRGGQITRDGIVEVWRKIWTRAIQLYLWSLGLTVASVALVVWLGRLPGTKAGLPDAIQFWSLIVDIIRLRYVYGWADFLPHYVIFMAIAPLALYLVYKRAAGVVVAASLVTWMLRGLNFEMAWQLLFFGGLVVGYYLPTIEAWASALRHPTRLRIFSRVVGLAVGTLIVNIVILYGQPLWHRWAAFNRAARFEQTANHFIGPYFDKPSLAVGRILMFALWFAALYLICRRYEVLLKRYLGGFLLPLSQNSLFVYGVHAIILLLVNLIIPHAVSVPFNILINTMVLGLIWCITTRYRTWASLILNLIRSRPSASKYRPDLSSAKVSLQK